MQPIVNNANFGNGQNRPKFKELVIQTVRLIPYGKVASYGQIAAMVDSPRAALQVGYILHDYGDDGKTPWWRVVNSKGFISTKCEEHTKNMQRDLLESEGIKVSSDLRIDMEKYRYIPTIATVSK
ncbi:methyltransferase [candidate division WWE3 bacterium]|uniref:Methyltransferase n=1 Tax=candidate division WWE3 bacterium TaxID=2053526 RepID=A0A7X9HHA3_UNCKA|nr:methyltransferase [candidate division WWE3 bacterium]